MQNALKVSPENFDSPFERPEDEKIFITDSIPFYLVHLGCALTLWTGFSLVAFSVCIALYLIRMFAITGGLHRYFAHRTYKTTRWFQFLLGLTATSAAQMGPLWWASYHRHHHRYSDQPEDVHSPLQRSFFWAHMGWFLCRKYSKTDPKIIADFYKYPELRWLNKYYSLPPLFLAIGLFLLGWALEVWLPEWNTTKWQMLVWGFCVSTVITYHCTFMVNSVVHLWGTRRYETSDGSRNNPLVALLTLGEGWHNNHHHSPQYEKHAHRWWEIDMTHMTLVVLEKLGIVWDIKTRRK